MILRIAVAVSEDGHWCAIGGGDGARDMGDCIDNCRAQGKGNIACYWIEVPVKRPGPATTLYAPAIPEENGEGNAEGED